MMRPGGRKGGPKPVEPLPGPRPYVPVTVLSLAPGLSAADELLLAPSSVAAVLAMLSTGARGRTLAQLNRLLVRELLEPPTPTIDLDGPGFQLAGASASWGRPWPANREQAWHDALRQGYDAPLRPVDFSRPELARSELNTWAAGRTDGWIPELVPAGAIGEGTRAVFAHALHLHCDWAERHERVEPQPVLRARGPVGHHAAGPWEAVALPATGPLMLLVARALVPGEGPPRLSGDGAAAVLEALTWAPRAVLLPRLQRAFCLPLAHALWQDGLADVFGGTADYAGIDARRGVGVTTLLHHTHLELDECGLRAVAATVAVVGDGGPPAPAPHALDHAVVTQLHDWPGDSCPFFVGRLADLAPVGPPAIGVIDPQG